MGRNVTLHLDDDVARWARIRAAELDTSVSGLVRDLLREQMERERAWEKERDRFFSVTPRQLRKKGSRLPSRESLHDRSRLR